MITCHFSGSIIKRPALFVGDGWLECHELGLDLKLNNPFQFGFLYSRLRWTRVDLQGKRRMACSTIGAMVTLIILSAMSTFC